jgi:hypothetical protein
MSQDIDSSDPEESGTPKVRSVASWEEISPEKLRQSAVSIDDEALGSDDALGAIGMAWFEVILGALLGLATMIGAWYWSDGGLGPFVAIPPVVLGVPLVLTKRHDLRYLGYGLLVAIPAGVVLGLLFWYLTLFI